MPDPKIYNDALNKFRVEYNLPDYDLEKEITADNVTRFFNNKSIGASAQQYERLAANAALKYFESSTTFQENGSQQLKGFDHSKFIADFEALMQARYDSKLEDGVESEKRTPFDGSDKEKLKIAINASANKVNKPLAELWADKLKSGAYKFKDLNSTVATQSSILFTANEKTEEHVRIFRDLVASREAVRELRASRKGIRGFFWRLFNREQNKQEKEFLTSLDSQINQLGELKGYDVNSALHDATNVTTWGKDLFERTYAQDLSIDKRAEEKLPINKNEEKEQVFKTEEAFIEASQTTVNNVKPVVQQVKEEKTNYTQRVNELLDDEEFSDNLLEQMTDVIEKMDSSLPKVRAVRRSLLRVGAFAEIQKAAKNFCERFDDAETPEAKEELMKNTALNVVGIISNNLYSYNLSAKDRFVAAQKMADLMFNQCSPIAFEKDKYAKYGDRYVAKDDKLLNMSIDAQHSSSSDRTIIEDIRKELGVDKSFDGLTEEEKEHQERERRQAEENRIREEKEKSMRQRLENIDKETPDLTTLFGDTERDRQEALERIEKQNPYWRSLQ